jgi:peptidoglycan-associated lipoprotein
MKTRLTVLFAILILVCGITGCKKPAEPPPAPPTATTTTPSTPPPSIESPVMKPIQEEPVTEISGDLDQINRSGLMKKIYFDFDRSDLRPDAIATLEANATKLKQYPSLRIRIEGHCDERGTEEYNIGLGDRRAKASYNYLVNLGISPSRMETVTYGKSQPEDPGHNEEAWATNRRDVFLVIAK